MRIFLQFIFLLVIMLFSPFYGLSQFIIAGNDNTVGYIYDYNPDTTVIGPYVYGGNPNIPSAFLYIDIDADGDQDVYLESWGSWTNGAGSYFTAINFLPSQGWEVAYGGIVMCPYSQDSSSFCPFPAVKTFKKGDTINLDYQWFKQTLNISIGRWDMKEGGCAYLGFLNDSIGSYVGLRKIGSQDTLYGWIKLNTLAQLETVVKEYACTKNISGVSDLTELVHISPNPTSGIIKIKSYTLIEKIRIYNQFGQQVFVMQPNDANLQIDLRNENNGLFLIELITSKNNMIRKVIKQ